MTSGRIEFPKLTHFSSAKYNTSGRIGFLYTFSMHAQTSYERATSSQQNYYVANRESRYRYVYLLSLSEALSDSPFLPLPGDVRQPTRLLPSGARPKQRDPFF